MQCRLLVEKKVEAGQVGDRYAEERARPLRCVVRRDHSHLFRCGGCGLFFFGVAVKERKKTDNPREGWEDGTPPPHREFKEECGASRRPP